MIIYKKSKSNLLIKYNIDPKEIEIGKDFI